LKFQEMPIYIYKGLAISLSQCLGDTMTNLINAPKVKRPSKKTIIREIMEIPTPTGGDFDMVSLERTNVLNLVLIRDLLLGGAK